MVGLSRQSKWASAAVWLIKYASKFQNRRWSSIEGDRATNGQKGRRDSITFGDIQPRLTSLRPARVGFDGADSSGNCSIFSYPDWYFHFSAHRHGIGETLQTEYSESIKKKSPNRELSPTRYISWQSKAAGNICS